MANYSVTAASVLQSVNASIKRGTAGAAITAGMSLAKDSSGNLVAFDANGVSPLNKFVGIAIAGAASGQQVLYTDDDPSFTPGFALAANAIVIGSATPGLMAPAADLATGDYLSIIGVGIGSNKMLISPLASSVATP